VPRACASPWPRLHLARQPRREPGVVGRGHRQQPLLLAVGQLKALTRGQGIDEQAMRKFIDGLALPEAAKARLRALTPAAYVGLAEKLARES
jgi:hypothetical protein